MPDPARDEARLQELLAEVLERVAEGGLAAAEPLLAEHAAFAPALRERLAKLQAAGLLAAVDPPAGVDHEAIPERLGDFRLVRRLGAGGMGVVYLAVQESLGREVALKLVRPEQLYFPGARERFRREVEAVARLNDPGIVAIHMVGEAGGIPFFAMERVVGATLADLLADLRGRDVTRLTGADMWAAFAARVDDVDAADVPPLARGTWLEACARLVEQMARAVAHAHANGVLHRDLKPANAMLRPDGRVVVLDFGLAHARDAAPLTRTGAQVGTLHAMAPEQLRGEHAAVDERADVYALGVLFYELLTLREPFAGTSYDVVARRILEGAPTPPSRWNAQVPWDYETVCLTAFDPVPARRYPSASALLRDLDNLLTHRPIAARRPGVGVRLRRFAQRHRALTAAATVGALALVATPLVIALRERALNRELQATIGERDREMARARTNVEVAAAALNGIVQHVADERLDEVPDLRGFSERLLEQTGGFLDTLIGSNPGEPAARLTLAETLTQAAMLRWRFLDFERTASLLRKALTLLAVDVAATIAFDRDRFMLARLDARLALALLQQRDLGPAAYASELAAALAEVGDEPPLPQRLRALQARFADGLERRCVLIRSQDPVAALALIERALPLREALADATGGVAELQALADCQGRLAQIGGEGAADRQRSAIAAQRATMRRALTCAVRDDAERTALGVRLLSHSYTAADDPEVGLEFARRATVLLKEATEERPSRIATRDSYASAAVVVAGYLRTLGRSDEAAAELESVAESLRPLVAIWPSAMPLRRTLLTILQNEADLLAALVASPATPAERRVELQARLDVLGAELLAAVRAARRDAVGSAAVLGAAADALGVVAMLAGRAGRRDEARRLIDEGLAVHAEAERVGRPQRTFIGLPLPLRLAEADLSLAAGDTAAALTALQSLGRTRIPWLFERVPGLAALRANPEFATVLTNLGVK